MHTKQIRWFGSEVTLACDGKCTKAWGLNCRPKVELDPSDPDDVAWLADDELGDAPQDPGTYEGGHAKPEGPHEMNKWCARECERSEIFDEGKEVTARDFSQRMYNQPWKHATSNSYSYAIRQIEHNQIVQPTCCCLHSKPISCGVWFPQSEKSFLPQLPPPV
jgi:hypothetical protein